MNALVKQKVAMMVLWIIYAVLLAGCQNELFKPALQADSSNAVVHIYRPKASTPGLAKPLVFAYPEVWVDDKSVGVIKYDEYTSFRVEPGKHAVRITGLTENARGWDLRDIKQNFRVEAGETKFMRLRVDFDVKEMSLTDPRPVYLHMLTPVSEEDALYEIRKTSASDGM